MTVGPVMEMLRRPNVPIAGATATVTSLTLPVMSLAFPLLTRGWSPSFPFLNPGWMNFIYIYI